MDYKDILSSELRMTYITLFVIILGSLLLAGLFLWWYKSFVNKKEKNKKQIKKRTKELRRWYICVVFVSALMIWGIIDQAVNIYQINYDIENEAYISYEGEISVSINRDFSKRIRAYDYYISFTHGEKYVSLCVDEDLIEKYGFYTGDFTSFRIVYSEKSQLLLAIYKIDD